MLGAALLVAASILFSCGGVRSPEKVADLLESSNAHTIPNYEVLELSFQHSGTYRNKFLDVDIAAVFISPGGVQHHVQGFYYGGDLWKVRFRPDAAGNWSYTYTFTGKEGFSKNGEGTFLCLPSQADGPVRRDTRDAFRWVFASGRPFFPVGLQDCVYVHGADLARPQIDGEGRDDSGRRVSWDEYFSIYGAAGFNLFRVSQKNCSYLLMDDLDHYRVEESMATDDLLSMARKHGFRVMFGFFGYHAQWPSANRTLRVLRRKLNGLWGTHEEGLWNPDDGAIIRKEERFLQYCIARWGVYTDFWELLNEREASDKWTTLMANYVHNLDPNQKPISTSWEKPDLPSIDINAPHWYESESELISDLRVQQQAVKWKQAGKPVVVGEQGNTGMNWDPLSAVRMRIRVWTGLFQEISFVFWNTNWSKQGMFGGRYTPGVAANVYLGPEERQYIKVFRDFSSQLDEDVRMAPISVGSLSSVRAYGLVSSNIGAIYLHHAENHTSPADNVEVSFDFSALPRTKLAGEWIDPGTGEVLSRADVPASLAALRVPPFKVDIALLIKPSQQTSHPSLTRR